MPHGHQNRSRAVPERPLNLTLVIGSNRHGRFGPVVADWLLDRIRDHDDLVPQVVDVAEISLPTSLAPTPEYNHSFPAGLRAVEHLRQVYAELHAVTIRDTVSFHNAGASFDDDGRLKDPSMPDAAAKAMLDQLVWWGRGLREAREKRPYAA
ncbi:NADPH-dependent FMN reductase [Streptomyces sp. GESEQ-35]|uniref:NADPH-dependent FMN reductase n=1 Tax=Streptomyces sp. GESEQ-35 TaxID=2812657 RepID=UPI0027E3168F|nr:NADPH-dependent FMN reductase [Streptomyces sp. GESEQ-35]